MKKMCRPGTPVISCPTIEKRCDVFTHFGGFFHTGICDGSTITVYEAFTASLPTVTIEIGNFGTCPVTLIVARQNSPTLITQVIAPDIETSLTVDLVTSISVQCSTGGGECSFSAGLDLSGCICC